MDAPLLRTPTQAPASGQKGSVLNSSASSHCVERLASVDGVSVKAAHEDNSARPEEEVSEERQAEEASREEVDPNQRPVLSPLPSFDRNSARSLVKAAAETSVRKRIVPEHSHSGQDCLPDSEETSELRAETQQRPSPSGIVSSPACSPGAASSSQARRGDINRLPRLPAVQLPPWLISRGPTLHSNMMTAHMMEPSLREKIVEDEMPLPRQISGMTVANLLSSPPPPPMRPKARSLEGSTALNSVNAALTASSSFRDNFAEAGPSKATLTAPQSPSQAFRSEPMTPSKGGIVGGMSASIAESPTDTPAYQYATVHQIVEDRENIEYILDIREQPKQSRMCGVGEKADRRPIDPAPIIQLRVITHSTPVKSTVKAIGDSIAGPMPRSRTGSDLTTRSAGTSRRGSMRNVHQMRRGEAVVTEHGQGWEDKAWYLENPYYFMCAMLADAEKDEELHLLSDGKTRYTTGSCVSCLYHLKDIDGTHQGFFVFPDLSIRIEGRYRLKLCLFETIGNEVHHCKSIYSAPFMVYTAKRFPGMEESTRLSRTFADQGLKVRVRKNPRGRRGKRERSGGRDSDEEDDGVGRNGHFDESYQKRFRSDSWLSTGSTEYHGPPSGMVNPSNPYYRPSSSPVSPEMARHGGSRGPSSASGMWQSPSQRLPGHPATYQHPSYLPSDPPRPMTAADPRRTSNPQMEQQRYRRNTPPHLHEPSNSSRDGAWPPPNQMLPPLNQGYAGSVQHHPDDHAPVHRGPLSSGDPRSGPNSPGMAHVRPPFASNKGQLSATASLTSRQRSASSAAAYSPRPWESRQIGGSRPGPLGPGPGPAALDGMHNSTGPMPARPVMLPSSRSHSQLLGHHRERSMSDPRRAVMRSPLSVVPPSGTAMAERSPERLRPGSRGQPLSMPMGATPSHERPTLPPLGRGAAAASPALGDYGPSGGHQYHGAGPSHHADGNPSGHAGHLVPAYDQSDRHSDRHPDRLPMHQYEPHGYDGERRVPVGNGRWPITSREQEAQEQERERERHHLWLQRQQQQNEQEQYHYQYQAQHPSERPEYHQQQQGQRPPPPLLPPSHQGHHQLPHPSHHDPYQRPVHHRQHPHDSGFHDGPPQQQSGHPHQHHPHHQQQQQPHPGRLS